MPPPQKPKDAYDAFSTVDKLVSKPILGSDGAASWQEFRNDNKKVYNKESTAPLAPLKKADKLGAGFSSWAEERSREEQVRKEAGNAGLGEGYKNFKVKAEDPQARKERKRIESRIRPEKDEYFIAAKTFEGWKWDYVFTTKPERGTGYYWDGGDSIKRLKGELPADAGPNNMTTAKKKNADESNVGKHERSSTDNGDQGEEEVKQKKKKKRKKSAPVIVENPNNPLEQVQEAIRKRNERLGLSNDVLPDGWEAAPDPNTGKVYYFHRQSGTRQWDKPKVETLPEGWSVATDASTGKQYYFHTSGETRWEKPT